MASTSEENSTESELNKNIENLEAHLGQLFSTQKALKILKNIGEYSCLIKLLKFNEYDLNFTIQIPGKFYLKTLRIKMR